PSSTTIVSFATAADTSERHAEEGWLEESGLSWTVPLLRRARRPHHRPGEAGANRGARDPARLARRLDLAAADRASPGHRGRQGRAAPIPLPPGVPGAAGAGEVRQADPVRGAAAAPPADDGRAHDARSAR